jgi:hypothetical protein
MCADVTRGVGACPVHNAGDHYATSNQSRHKFARLMKQLRYTSLHDFYIK